MNDDEPREQCCMPMRCVMSGPHFDSECHTREMVEDESEVDATPCKNGCPGCGGCVNAQTHVCTRRHRCDQKHRACIAAVALMAKAKREAQAEHDEPAGGEHASDHWQGEELAKHYRLPWAMVGRVPCVEHGPGGEPYDQIGEAIVRLPNWGPEHADPAVVHLAIGGPYLPMGERRRGIRDGGAASELTSSEARALGQYLIEAADLAGGQPVGAAEPESAGVQLAPDAAEWVIAMLGEVAKGRVLEMRLDNDSQTLMDRTDADKMTDEQWENEGLPELETPESPHELIVDLLAAFGVKAEAQ